MLQNLWVQLLFQKKWHSIRNKKKMLWIKHYDYPTTRISHSNWSNIDYLATNIRKELQIKGEVVIQDSLDQKEIEPAISLNRFTTCVLSTLKTRLIADSDTVKVKKIFIMETDSDGTHLGTYFSIKIKNDLDVKYVYTHMDWNIGSGLYLISEPEILLTKNRQLKDGHKYAIFSRYQVPNYI